MSVITHSQYQADCRVLWPGKKVELIASQYESAGVAVWVASIRRGIDTVVCGGRGDHANLEDLEADTSVLYIGARRLQRAEAVSQTLSELHDWAEAQRDGVF